MKVQPFRCTAPTKICECISFLSWTVCADLLPFWSLERVTNFTTQRSLVLILVEETYFGNTVYILCHILLSTFAILCPCVSSRFYLSFLGIESKLSLNFEVTNPKSPSKTMLLLETRFIIPLICSWAIGTILSSFNDDDQSMEKSVYTC